MLRIAPPRAPRAIAACAAVSLVAGAGAAWADLTADEVWQSWQDLVAAGGQTISAAEETRDGDTLALRGVTVSGVADEVTITTTVNELTFTETDDGSVSVRMSDAYGIDIIGTGNELLRLAVAHPGLRMVVSEDADGLRHTVNAPELSVSVAEASGPDVPERLEFLLEATRVAGSYDVARDSAEVSATQFTAGRLDLEVGVTDDGDLFDLTYAATGLDLRFAGVGLDQGDRIGGGDMGGALAEGLSIDLGLSYDTLSYDVALVEDGEASGAAGSAMSGDMRFMLDASELSFRTSNRNGEVTLRGPELPMPEVTLRAAELTYGLSVPTSGAPATQQASLLVRLVEAVASDSVWAMADPSGALPREPVTAIIDLAAELILPADLFGMETMFGFMMGGPFEAVQPTAFDIREVLVRAGGAELTGEGSFLLDPTDLSTFDGVPRPEGELSLRLRGGNALLDTLVGMGMLPPDQANAARMVMALFARPGDEQDELLSTIEIREGGAVFANGMRLQ